MEFGHCATSAKTSGPAKRVARISVYTCFSFVLRVGITKGELVQIDTLRYFVELARVGSFYGAAKNVYISQQGLSKAISALEAELGVKLVERESRGVRLTGSGEVLLDHAKVLLDEYSDTLKDLYAHHATASSDDVRLVIHMTYYPTQIAEPFVRQMKSFESINLVEEPFQQLIEGALNSDGSELFLCDIYGATELPAKYPNLAFEPMVATRAGVIWSKGSPLRVRGSVHREQLADIPLSIDSHREMRRLAEYIMEDYPLNNIQMGMANPRGRIELAGASAGLTLLYDSFGFMLIQANPQLANKALHFAPFSTPRSITQVGFVYNKKARPNVRARHVIEVLRSHLRTKYSDYMQEYPLG